MTRRIAMILVSCVGSALAQYDDYPVGQYEFSHNRFVVSPVKLMGGMDGSKRDEGPKVDLKWTPNIDIQEMRYEYILGVDGTFGVGPIGTLYLGLDSVKVNSFAIGVFGRYYLGLASGPYAQFNLQYYKQGATKVHGGVGQGFRNPNDTTNKVNLSNYRVEVGGPQLSPVLGYSAIFGNHLVLETQMGFTFGRYSIDMPDGIVYTQGGWGLPKAYRAGQDWGGFYFVQASLGVAW